MFIKTRKKANVSEFIPKNPGKYVGRYPILVRSSWERMFAQWLDLTESIVKWSSESIQILYFDPVLQKRRRYYPDFFFATKDGNKYITEIKPKKDIVFSKKGKVDAVKKFMREKVCITNQAKFKAAEDYCRKAGFKFKILTETELFNK